jgi:hypothetical protein
VRRWYIGWRIEYAMDAHELVALKRILNTAQSTNELPPIPNVSACALMKKVYNGCASVAAHAGTFPALFALTPYKRFYCVDRFYSQSQHAYTTDIPQYRHRIQTLEQNNNELRAQLQAMNDHNVRLQNQLAAAGVARVSAVSFSPAPMLVSALTRSANTNAVDARPIHAQTRNLVRHSLKVLSNGLWLLTVHRSSS